MEDKEGEREVRKEGPGRDNRVSEHHREVVKRCPFRRRPGSDVAPSETRERRQSNVLRLMTSGF